MHEYYLELQRVFDNTRCNWVVFVLIGARAYSNAQFGQGTGPIQLDNVQCSGTEQRLLSCSHSRSHNCTHHEDAGVYCSSTVGES